MSVSFLGVVTEGGSLKMKVSDLIPVILLFAGFILGCEPRLARNIDDPAANATPTPIPSISGAIVLGQPDFTTQEGLQKGLNSPHFVIRCGSSKLLIADASNNRVLIYNQVPTAAETLPDVVLGQPDRNANVANNTAGAQGTPSAGSLSHPTMIACTGTILMVADRNNNRVLIWNPFPTSNQAAANIVLGQPNFTSNTVNNGGIGAATLNTPEGIATDGTRLFVADTGNHRVLDWIAIPAASQAAANFVLGQPNFTSSTANNGGIGAGTLNFPVGLAVDASALFVADESNSRVLAWYVAIDANQKPATNVLGQPNMTSSTANNGGISAATLNFPSHVCADTTKVYVGDDSNNRVLIWDNFPFADGVLADRVLGQLNFTSNTANNGGISNKTLNGALADLAPCSDGTSKIFVADNTNNRVLIWNTLSPTNGQAADLVIGQSLFTTNNINSGQRVTAKTLSNPQAVWSDGTRVVVSDTSNNRVLIWNSIPTSNAQSADLVLGQPDFTSVTASNGGVSDKSLSSPQGLVSDGTRLFIVDNSNSRVLGWPAFPTTTQQAASFALGQPSLVASTPNNGGIGAGTLSFPASIAIGGSSLYVSDTSNSRVLIWNALPSTNAAAANVVIGQPNFTSFSNATTSQKLNFPQGIFADTSHLYVADTVNHRVLIWNTLSLSTGQAADLVLGQTNFTTRTQGVSASTMDSPGGVFSDGTSLFVAEETNNRVLIWNSIPTVSTTAANSVLGQLNLTSKIAAIGTDNLSRPEQVFITGNILFIVDTSNSRVIIRPKP